MAELYAEILRKLLPEDEMCLRFPKLVEYLPNIVEGRCYVALLQIRDILENTAYNDPACFMRIEEIVCAFEEMGSGCTYRHDFG